jgi:chromosome segregation ATPase
MKTKKSNAAHKANITRRNARIAQLESLLAVRKEDIADLTNSVEALIAERLKLTEKIGALHGTNEALQKQVADLQAKLKAADESHKLALKGREELRTELSQKKEELYTCDWKLQNETKDLIGCRNRIRDLEHKLDQITRIIAAP